MPVVNFVRYAGFCRARPCFEEVRAYSVVPGLFSAFPDVFSAGFEVF
jgi:hypothetical protein